jgi:hypothetical protein
MQTSGSSHCGGKDDLKSPKQNYAGAAQEGYTLPLAKFILVV